MTQPQCGEGLVFPEGFPCKASQINVDTIETAGGNLRAMGVTVDSHMDSIVSTWNGLPAVYVGPGAEQAYALMTPAAAASEELKQALSKAGEAIEEYARTLVPIKTGLSNLEMEATAFRTKVLAGDYGDDWRTDLDAVTKNTAFLERYAAMYESLTTAAATCANAIYAQLTRTSALEVTGVSAESILDGGGLTPWGPPMPQTPSCNESALQGAGKLQPTTWDAVLNLYGYNQILQDPYGLSPSWLGAGDFAGASTLYLTLTNPATGGMLPTDDNEEEEESTKLPDVFNKPKRPLYNQLNLLEQGLDWAINFTAARIDAGGIALDRHWDAWGIMGGQIGRIFTEEDIPTPAEIGASGVLILGTGTSFWGNVISGQDLKLFDKGEPHAGPIEIAPTGNNPTTNMVSLTENTMAAYEMFDKIEKPDPLDRGAVRIEKTPSGDGVNRYIVSVPGTQEDLFNSAGWTDMSTARNWSANIYAIAEGSEATNAQAVMMAIRENIPEGSEVLLTGHSQGGIIVSNLATDDEFTSEYEIAGIVGYGAPMDTANRDPSIPVLDIKHRYDIVPTLDFGGLPSTDTDIILDRPEGSPSILNPGAFIWDQHLQGSYSQDMANLTATNAAQIDKFVTDNNLDRFFTPDGQTSQIWRIPISGTGR